MKFRQPLKLESTDAMALSIAPESYDAKTGELDITWLDGTDMERRDPYGDKYILRFYPEGMNLERVNGGGASVFWNHPQMQPGGTSAIEPKHVIGNSLSASVSSAAKGSAHLRLIPFNPDPIATRPPNQEGAFLFANGFVRGVSMGWQYDEVSIEEFPETDQPPVVHVKRCTILEFSAAPIQQVASAQTANLKEAPMSTKNDPNKGEPTTENQPAAGADAAALAAANEEGAKRERERIAGINQTCAALGIGLDVATKAITDGVDLQKFRDEQISAKATAGDAAGLAPQVRPGRDAGDTLRKSFEDALYANSTGKNVSDVGRQFMGRSYLEMVRLFAVRSGVAKAESWDPDQILEFSRLGSASVGIAPGDLPNLLQSAGNRMLLEALKNTEAFPYDDQITTAFVPDFRLQTLIDFGFIGTLEKVPAGKKPNSGTVTESTDGYKLARRMAKHEFSYEAQLCDDQNAFSRWADEEASAILETRWESFIEQLEAGQVQGKAICHADHGNLASSGAAPSVDTIGAGRLAMRKQTNIAGRKTPQYPDIILFPAELETSVDRLLDPKVVATKASDSVPTWIRSLRPVSEPRLSSAKAWWLLNSRVRWMVEARLRSAPQPQFRKVVDEETLGINLIVDWSFVHKTIRYQPVYKNPGE